MMSILDSAGMSATSELNAAISTQPRTDLNRANSIAAHHIDELKAFRAWQRRHQQGYNRGNDHVQYGGGGGYSHHGYHDGGDMMGGAHHRDYGTASYDPNFASTHQSHAQFDPSERKSMAEEFSMVPYHGRQHHASNPRQMVTNHTHYGQGNMRGYSNGDGDRGQNETPPQQRAVSHGQYETPPPHRALSVASVASRRSTASPPPDRSAQLSYKNEPWYLLLYNKYKSNG